MMAQHFPLDSIIPQYLFIQSPHDMRNPKVLADMEQMAQRVSQLPGVSMVRGMTRPMGESLEQARLAWQAGEVGNKLGDASQQINGHTNDLDTMSDGANQLANALGDLRNQVDQALPTISGLVESLTFLQKNFGGQKTLNQINDAAKLLTNMRSLGQTLDLNVADVNNLAGIARPILNALDATPVCSLDPNCVNARDEFQRIADAHDSGALTSVADLSKQLNQPQGTHTLEATTGKLRELIGKVNSPSQLLGAARRPVIQVGDPAGWRRSTRRRQPEARRCRRTARRSDQEDGRGSQRCFGFPDGHEVRRHDPADGGLLHSPASVQPRRIQKSGGNLHLA